MNLRIERQEKWPEFIVYLEGDGATETLTQVMKDIGVACEAALEEGVAAVTFSWVLSGKPYEAMEKRIAQIVEAMAKRGITEERASGERLRLPTEQDILNSLRRECA